MEPQLLLTPSPYSCLTHRFLGAIPELVAAADKHSPYRGETSTTWVRNWLKQNAWALQRMGLDLSDMPFYQVDHIWPHSKCGRSNPKNFMLTETGLNQSFNGYITLEKCMYVGLPVMMDVMEYHARKLAVEQATWGSQQQQFHVQPVYAYAA